jgi:hypothetical protein
MADLHAEPVEAKGWFQNQKQQNGKIIKKRTLYRPQFGR